MSIISGVPLQEVKEHHQLLKEQFEAQKSAYEASPYPSYEERVTQLKALKREVLDNRAALTRAMSLDFGYRSENDSLIGDVFPVISQINYTLRKLRKWLRAEKRHSGLLLAPASVSVEYQPKGVVGIVSPWNFPVNLSLSPLVTSVAAGNRTMIKVSEFTPETNKVLRSILGSTFNSEQVTLIEGEADIASAFSSLPFDHILFTGSTQVGKQVMRAASENLTPVTLELGGKSPALIAPDMSISEAVERVIYGKCLNAGQICVSPDYILCHEDKAEAFISGYCAKFQSLYPDFSNNSDYSAIVNDRQALRLSSLLKDAADKGAEIYSADGNSTGFDSATRTGDTEESVTRDRIWPTQLVRGINADMKIMQEEIFGPLLPIVTYKTLDEAIGFIKSQPRPLALYLMSFDEKTQKRVLEQTHAGGVCINDTVFHVAAEDAPFGGIGASGIGHYHGIEGFRTLSHAKTVLKRGKINTGKLIQPPYNRLIQKAILKFFLR